MVRLALTSFSWEARDDWIQIEWMKRGVLKYGVWALGFGVPTRRNRVIGSATEDDICPCIKGLVARQVFTRTYNPLARCENWSFFISEHWCGNSSPQPLSEMESSQQSSYKSLTGISERDKEELVEVVWNDLVYEVLQVSKSTGNFMICSVFQIYD